MIEKRRGKRKIQRCPECGTKLTNTVFDCLNCGFKLKDKYFNEHLRKNKK